MRSIARSQPLLIPAMAEQPEAPAAAEEVPVQTGPKGVVLIGALVGTLLLGGAAGVVAIGPMIATKAGYAVALHPDSAVHGGASGGATAEGGEHGSGKEGEGSGGGAASNLHLIDNLVLNPAGSGGARFLMLAAAIELKEAAQVEELKARDAEVRDVVLRVMGAKTVDQLSAMANREALKQELGDSLGALFKEPRAIRRIYFPQFVIQ